MSLSKCARHLSVVALSVSTAASGTAGAAGGQPGWVDVAAERRLVFEHRVFEDGSKHMPENMGAGVAILDYDGDGDLDVYLVQGAPVVGEAPAIAENRLFRQEADGGFLDVTGLAGVGNRGVGMGVAVGDVDGDGHPDLYVTNYGPNVLYRNRGDGTFEDVTGMLRVGGDDWSTGAAFVDLDHDGDEDLYVANYLDYDPSVALFCGNAQSGLRAYCHPDLYPGQPDTVFLNEGDSSPWRAGESTLGVLTTADARGLGVLAADFDGDGRFDLYVANDTTANHLYLGAAEGKLAERALPRGIAVNGDGRAEASMGLAMGDLDGDGERELFATHLDEETNTLYRAGARGLFEDDTETAGLAAPSRPWVGFGTAMSDFDLDGDLDLVVANGHIIDNIAAFEPALSHAQPLQFFLNDGAGRFRELPDVSVSTRLVGRGLAVGDLDRDGDPDLVVTQNGGPVVMLDNRLPAPARGSISLSFASLRADDLGSSWSVVDALASQVRWLERAPSYLSQSAPEILLVADSPTLQAEGRWRGGRVLRFAALQAGLRYRLP